MGSVEGAGQEALNLLNAQSQDRMKLDVVRRLPRLRRSVLNVPKAYAVNDDSCWRW